MIAKSFLFLYLRQKIKNPIDFDRFIRSHPHPRDAKKPSPFAFCLFLPEVDSFKSNHQKVIKERKEREGLTNNAGQEVDC